MSRIYAVLVILMLSGQTSFLFAQEKSEGDYPLPLSDGTYSGFEETTYSEPNWVLVLSDLILREDYCSMEGIVFEKVFNPCYKICDTPKYNRYWALELCAEPGQAFSMSAFGTVGTGSLDSLYVREGFGFQLYGLDEQPYGPYMTGPKYVSIDHWFDVDTNVGNLAGIQLDCRHYQLKYGFLGVFAIFLLT